MKRLVNLGICNALIQFLKKQEPGYHTVRKGLGIGDAFFFGHYGCLLIYRNEAQIKSAPCNAERTQQYFHIAATQLNICFPEQQFA